jgi:hypothetical protein
MLIETREAVMLGKQRIQSRKSKKSNDGRDRSQTQVVDHYPANDTQVGRQAEQQQIDQQGGVQNLDNKRNEIAPKKEPQQQ